MIQDIYPHVYNNAFEPGVKPSNDDIIFSFEEDQVLMKDEHQFYHYQDISKESICYYLFSIDDIKFFLADLTSLNHIKVSFRTMRTFENQMLGFAAITAWHLYRWIQDNKYCGKCGHPMDFDKKERAMRCPHCSNIVYPKISPAVIVGVINDKGQILVTKYARGHYQSYALVAGYYEIGETIEETVKREVKEETGLDITDIQYYKSQPWSFSSSLLFGFWCKAHGDQPIQMDESELRVARWADRDEEINTLDNASLTSEMIQYFKQGKVV